MSDASELIQKLIETIERFHAINGPLPSKVSRPSYLEDSAGCGKAIIEPWAVASEVQVSYNLAREDKDLTTATIARVFENGVKVLCHLEGDDAEAFIDVWNARHVDRYQK